MAARRLKLVALLLLLVGGPVLVLAGIIGAGVVVGARHRAAVIAFEERWLGWPAPAAGAKRPTGDAAASDATSDAGAVPPEVARTEPALSEGGRVDPPTLDGASGEGGTGGHGRSSGDIAPSTTLRPTPPVPTVDDPTPIGSAEAVPTALEELFALKQTVRVKVLVDPAVIAAHPDWIDLTQRTVSRASQVYVEHFGIELLLDGVGRWPVATAGMSATELLQALKERPREDAHILIGFTARPADGDTSGKSETYPDAPWNGAYAVVYASAGEPRSPYLRTFVHEVAHLFGAADIADPRDPRYLGKSFMSYAPYAPGDPLWIDSDNRVRVLRHKGRPFIPESELANIRFAEDAVPTPP